MKQIKLNNVIFPVWFLLFMPPVTFITLFGNFIIDSIVVMICFSVFKLSNHIDLKAFYKKNILKVWIFGFLSDILGAIILLYTGILGNFLNLPSGVITGINFDPFSNIGALLIVILAMLVSAFFIFIFNYNLTFKKSVEDKKLRFKVAITLAIVTMPWTFLIPTKWFYKGF